LEFISLITPFILCCAKLANAPHSNKQRLHKIRQIALINPPVESGSCGQWTDLSLPGKEDFRFTDSEKQ
jgi:hypothetical protein